MNVFIHIKQISLPPYCVFLKKTVGFFMATPANNFGFSQNILRMNILPFSIDLPHLILKEVGQEVAL